MKLVEMHKRHCSPPFWRLSKALRGSGGLLYRLLDGSPRFRAPEGKFVQIDSGGSSALVIDGSLDFRLARSTVAV